MFSDSQARDFTKAVRKRFGDGWALLVPDLREAVIAEKAFSVCAGQHAGSVSCDDMADLLQKMRRFAHLTKEETP